jgi:hypothetical protein
MVWPIMVWSIIVGAKRQRVNQGKRPDRNTGNGKVDSETFFGYSPFGK